MISSELHNFTILLTLLEYNLDTYAELWKARIFIVFKKRLNTKKMSINCKKILFYVCRFFIGLYY